MGRYSSRRSAAGWRWAHNNRQAGLAAAHAGREDPGVVGVLPAGAEHGRLSDRLAVVGAAPDDRDAGAVDLQIGDVRPVVAGAGVDGGWAIVLAAAAVALLVEGQGAD